MEILELFDKIFLFCTYLIPVAYLLKKALLGKLGSEFVNFPKLYGF